MKLNCLIIDDEPVARKGMSEFAEEVDFLQVTAQCENAVKAIAVLQSQSIDLIFLDIQMPKTSGIELLKALKNPPLAIITTAFPDYALEGFELDVVDYLVKPVAFERFQKAVTKARDIFNMRNQAAGTQPDYFFVKSNGRYEKVMFEELVYAEAWQNYCILHLPGKKIITYITFTALEKQLPQDRFIKIHKSYIISIAKVDKIDGHEVKLGEVSIPVSRLLKEEVTRKILGSNYLKRS